MRYWSVLFALAAILSVVSLRLRPVLARLVAARGRQPGSRHLDLRPGDRQPLHDHPLDHRHRLHRHADRPGVGPYRFADELDAQGKPVRPAQYFHGSQRLEVIWTIIPAAILVFIALYQMGTWASIKFRSAAPRVPALGRDHRPPVSVGDALPRRRRQAEYTRRPVHCQRPALRQEQTGADLLEIVGRAPFVLSCRSCASSRMPCRA